MSMLDIPKRLFFFLVLCLAQMLVLNRIHLFGYATPLLYVYFVLLFPYNYPKGPLLLWCFALGLVNDTISNTPGVACASLTLIGALQPYYLSLFLPRDVVDNFESSMHSLGYLKFAAYAVPLILLYCLLFFALEAFNFFNWEQWLICSGSSALLTLLFIFVFENFRVSKPEVAQ